LSITYFSFVTLTDTSGRCQGVSRGWLGVASQDQVSAKLRVSSSSVLYVCPVADYYKLSFGI